MVINRVKIASKYLTPSDATIKEAMQRIDKSELQFTMVVMDDNKALGTLTDGDIRRALINGANLDTRIEDFINKNFIYVAEDVPYEQVNNLMRESLISQIPILDHEHKVLGLFVRNFDRSVERNDTPIFLLAGGLGTRLRPLTDNYPKPLIEIGGRPILEHIIIEFARQGFHNIFISINFQGKLIKNFFGDGKKWGVNIQYIEEKHKLGTAGSLSLLKNLNYDNILVMNGDLLTQVNFNHLLAHHLLDNADVTICSRAYIHQVPFGVLLLDGVKVEGIDEKPIIKQMISAGIYLFKKDCITMLEYDNYCDMPDLIERLIQHKFVVQSFETRDSWIDIGRMTDLERARSIVSAKQNHET